VADAAPVAPPSPSISQAPKVMFALVVDDEPANRDFLERLLQQTKMQVKGASTGAAALQIAEDLGAELRLVMLDYKLPDQSGLELLVKMRAKLPEAKIIMATMYDEPGMIRKSFEAGCTAYIVKPHGFMEVFKLIRGVADDPSCLEQLDGLIFDQYGQRAWRG
jgi:CheY-like chemotaxis protein